MRQLAVLVPPLPLFVLARRAGAKAARTNLLIAAIAVAGAAGLIALTGDYGQWIAVAVVFYAILSWCQSLAAREPDVYRLTAGSPAMLCLILGTATVAICNGAVGFWAAPLAIRSLGLDPGSAGTLLGLALGIGPFAGIFLAGIVADRWRQTNIAAPVWVILAGMIQCAAMLGLMLTASDPMIYAIAVAGVMLGSSAWFPVIAAAVQDLVTPSMRGRAAAFYSVVLNSFGMSAGAYSAGKVADLTGSLKIGLLVPFATLPIGVLLLVVCVGLLPSAHRKRDEIAARNGETASAAAH
jgi:MFS family permease